MYTSLFALKRFIIVNLSMRDKTWNGKQCLSSGQSIELAVSGQSIEFANTSKSPLARKPNQEGMHSMLVRSASWWGTAFHGCCRAFLGSISDHSRDHPRAYPTNFLSELLGSFSQFPPLVVNSSPVDWLKIRGIRQLMRAFDCVKGR